ncbi:MAG: hypothetical protein OEW33_02010 [Nitrospirota bacterium]|nr:hypothetical protein [Nitrospirota bacterium]
MMVSKVVSASPVVMASIFSMLVHLSPIGNVNVVAALNADEVLTAGDPAPADNPTAESSLELRRTPGWGKRLLGETIYNPNNFQEGLSQSQSSPFLHLKSPGKLPGIEFRVEMHSLQALQSVVPPESFPKGLDLKQEQGLLLPPSINAPDYNAGFLRFTW